MDFKGKYTIPATPERVWGGLHDPIALSACIPGCESIEKISDREYKASATIKIGPVRARFEGAVTLQDMAPPPGVLYAMVLAGEGLGGAAGFARGQSEVRLSSDGDQTLLEYTAKAIVGGRLAQIGQRLIDGAAKSIADEFFGKFSALMRASMPGATPLQAVPPGDPAPAQVPPSSEGLAPQVWVAGLIGIIVILLVFFSIVL